MKPAGLILCCFAGAALAASETDPPPLRRLSSQVAEAIRASLPKFQPPPITPAPAADSANQSDVLQLPKMTVQEKRAQVLAPDTLLSRDELGRKMEREYLSALADVSDLNYVLNSIYIPLFSAPVRVRAREAYLAHRLGAEFSRLTGLADALQALDPHETDRLKRDLDFSRLPGK